MSDKPPEYTWEALRKWEVVRYLVYYLTENLVPPEIIPGKTVVDFSCGIGDLSEYCANNGASQVFATQPEPGEPPDRIKNVAKVRFHPGVQAKDIAATFDKDSVDLFVARMVFQFPTVEDHFIDVDGMLSQVHSILKPGGTLIVCSHEHTEIVDTPEFWNLDLETHFAQVLKNCSDAERQRRNDLIELIQTIGLPPREGVHGQTGFGLKAVMFVDSVVQHGFTLQSCSEIEDFTFPRGLARAIENDIKPFAELAQKAFEIKQKEICSSAYKDKYKRPQVLQSILTQLNALHPFCTLPIFSVVASK